MAKKTQQREYLLTSISAELQLDLHSLSGIPIGSTIMLYKVNRNS